ncbi:MAG: hypothetical protein ACLPUT_02270 [Solirubrobacteraceae bacterium]
MNGGALLAALALAGCGGASGSGATRSTVAEGPKSPLQSVVLESPAIAGAEAIPRLYTCDGKDVSPPLRWKHLPPATKELLLLVLSLKPATGTVRETSTVEWAVAGLHPTLRQLATGGLPAGAIVGRNALGHTSYRICPVRGTSGSYLILLFASPRRLALRPGFSDESLLARLSQIKPPYGQIAATYSRTT